MNKFLLLTCLLICGCGAIDPIGPVVNGIIFWKQGEANKYYNQKPDVVFRASLHALNRMNLKVVKDSNFDKSNFEIIAGNNNRFKIYIKEVDNKITSLKVRINFFGDKQYAELFYKYVDEQIEIIRFDGNGMPVRNI